MTVRRFDPQDSPTRTGDCYRQLPEPVRLEDTITGQAVDPPPDPYAGRDPRADFGPGYGG